MNKAIDDLLNSQPFYVPPSDRITVPAWIEVAPSKFVSLGKASREQLLVAAELHAEIARRHRLEAKKLRAAAARRD